MGYAAKEPEGNLDMSDEYFLFHHGITRKVIVFDSASLNQGRCLNDAFLSEPSWQTQLS